MTAWRYFYLRNSSLALGILEFRVFLGILDLALGNSRLWNSSLGILDLALGILKFIEKFRIP